MGLRGINLDGYDYAIDLIFIFIQLSPNRQGEQRSMQLFTPCRADCERFTSILKLTGFLSWYTAVIDIVRRTESKGGGNEF